MIFKKSQHPKAHFREIPTFFQSLRANPNLQENSSPIFLQKYNLYVIIICTDFFVRKRYENLPRKGFPSSKETGIIMVQDITSRISESYPTLSKSQRRIASAVLNSCDKVAFMTAAKLGQTVGVSESTVVRFAIELGFDGYPEFQRAVQELVRAYCLFAGQYQSGDHHRCTASC